MIVPLPSTPMLLLVSAVLALLLLPLPMVLALGLVLALGFAIDVAALRRQAAPALRYVRKR
jgi:hypothetical protein